MVPSRTRSLQAGTARPCSGVRTTFERRAEEAAGELPLVDVDPDPGRAGQQEQGMTPDHERHR